MLEVAMYDKKNLNIFKHFKHLANVLSESA